MLLRYLWLLLLSGSFAVHGEDIAATQASDFTLSWGVNPAPPFHILEGNFAGRGMCDVLVDKVNAALPDIRHEVMVLPHSRLKENVVQNKNLCFPCMIKRQSSPHFVYTEQTVEHPPLGIIARPALPAGLHASPEQPLSLASLAADSSFRFGQPAARRYPAVLQAIVDTHQTESYFFRISGAAATVRILQQIEMGRLDYTLDYPTVLNYYKRTHPDTPLVFIPTAETGVEPVPGAIGCTNNAWGEQAVEHINRALTDILADEEYQQSQLFWQQAE